MTIYDDDQAAHRLDALITIAQGEARQWQCSYWIALYCGEDADDSTEHEIYLDSPESTDYADIHQIDPDGSVSII
jgi:hypothetical protein